MHRCPVCGQDERAQHILEIVAAKFKDAAREIKRLTRQGEGDEDDE